MLLVVTIFFVLVSCDESPTNPGGGFNGITHTDETGQQTGQTDLGDWNSAGILTPYPAYPNPFTSSITISYKISKSCLVNITVNDTPDNEIRELVSKTLPAGTYKVIWDGKDKSDQTVSNEIYRVYLKATYNDTTDESYGDLLKLSN